MTGGRLGLTSTVIRDADLSEANGLTQHQINVAIGNSSTKLPEGLSHPTHWTDDLDDDLKDVPF